jgi:hypothetical protein
MTAPLPVLSTQQYCFAAFISMDSQTRKEKFGVHFKRAISFFYVVKFFPILKRRYSKLR